MAARYVKNVGKAPRYCAIGKPDGQVVAKPSVKIRTTPSVDGNKRWYQLRDGTWVPARWVENLDQRVPQPC